MASFNKPLLVLGVVVLATTYGQFAAWPVTSYSPFLQTLLAPIQNPVAPIHVAAPGARYYAHAPAFTPVVPGLFAANMVPRVIPHGPPQVVSYNPSLRIYG